MATLLRVAVLAWVPLLAGLNEGPARGQDIRYLVIRRAGHPEKNYYELAKQVGLLDGEVVTRDPPGIRYGVHSIWKVRVQRVSDSLKESVSTRDAHYVMIYERDPDLRFCALGYKVSDLPLGARRVAYTDCEDKKQYWFETTPNWPRPFVIYEVEVLDRAVLQDLWAKREPKAPDPHPRPGSVRHRDLA